PVVGKELRRLVIGNPAPYGAAMAFAPDCRSLLAASSNSARLWELATGKERGIYGKRLGAIWCVTFSPNGRWGALAGESATIHVFDLAEEKEVKQLKGHQSAITSLAFAPDSRFLYSGSRDATAFIWDVRPPTEPTQKENRLSGEDLQ